MSYYTNEIWEQNSSDKSWKLIVEEEIRDWKLSRSSDETVSYKPLVVRWAAETISEKEYFKRKLDGKIK